MLKRAAQALGFAAILLLPNYIDLTSSTGDTRMRFPLPLTRIALAQLTDLVIVAAVFAVAMGLLRRLRFWPQICWGLLAFMPVLLFVRNLNVFPFDIPGVAVLTISLLWIALVITLVLRWSRLAIRLRKAGSSVLTGFVIFALVICGQLIRAALWYPGPQSYAAPVPVQPASKPRLVWIVFDELAYEPTFEARDASLGLPNFDRLRRESTLYTDVTPIAYRTTRAIPSLLLGQVVTDVEYTADDRYLVKTADSQRWQSFDTRNSLFGIAQQNGLTISIVGWYVAYCPVFNRVATQCYWSNDDAQDRGPTSLSASYAENVWFPLRIMVEQFFDPSKAWADVSLWNARGHIASVQDISEHALATVADSQADLIYLHLPVPHPPEFWNRRTGTFAPGGSYLDSLDYCDRLLGKILDLLESQQRWSGTTLIVQGDHSWRTQMWRPLPGWSTEDESISRGGAWDPRPVLLIHAAGQQQPGTISTPTSEMLVHDEVAAEIRAYTPSLRAR